MIAATSAPRFASIAEHATCRSVRAMLAYVFWHVAAAGTGREDYETRLAGFHAALRDDSSPGLGATATFGLRGVPWLGDRGGYEDWYRRWWDYAATYLVRQDGSWQHELDEENRPAGTVWPGRPDLYHSVHAVLLQRLPLAPSAPVALAAGLLR